MHFSAFFLALVPVAVRGLTIFSNFECGGTGTASTTVGCIASDCSSFDGFHSFENVQVVIPQYVQTYENADCTSPVPPVNFTAPPHSCVAAITGRPIRSFRCQLDPYV